MTRSVRAIPFTEDERYWFAMASAAEGYFYKQGKPREQFVCHCLETFFTHFHTRPVEKDENLSPPIIARFEKQIRAIGSLEVKAMKIPEGDALMEVALVAFAANIGQGIDELERRRPEHLRPSEVHQVIDANKDEYGAFRMKVRRLAANPRISLLPLSLLRR